MFTLTSSVQVITPSLEDALVVAYTNGLNSYQVALYIGCVEQVKTQTIFDAQLDGLDEESMLEQIELLLRFKPEQLKSLLQKWTEHTRAPYAKLGLVSIGAASELLLFVFSWMKGLLARFERLQHELWQAGLSCWVPKVVQNP